MTEGKNVWWGVLLTVWLLYGVFFPLFFSSLFYCSYPVFPIHKNKRKEDAFGCWSIVYVLNFIIWAALLKLEMFYFLGRVLCCWRISFFNLFGEVINFEYRKGVLIWRGLVMVVIFPLVLCIAFVYTTSFHFNVYISTLWNIWKIVWLVDFHLTKWKEWWNMK